ncbi:hypothetical protein UFOVP582_32 [uncultured Caudovirales phage]|uniref:PA14 domain containing protein n=1 Tax=uncultured Caudovirales phage TaxID=2100421 RepID=A0A6J5QI01_9CAUD|nr:hypothetical protein UFOVP582_32 [uncultured Caudovirales phage]CAB4183953.1 hypothetical protein UFOVP1099_22 [uncultured Caudovirales phage]CAB4214292.1 hypothetical protein UFOVP1460_27 [uncultured Caudovirales phage]CAB5228537.1 hypothetical protein UFOVP1548_2 [uncultured Caudovirales phage]
MARYSRWLIFVPVAILALWNSSVHAESQQGLEARYFIIDEIPPVMSEHIYTECGSEVENNINRSYDGEPFLGCPDDMFMVHITGTIIIPEHDTIQFWLASDDGGTIKIGLDEWGVWNDQGCSATESGPIDISAGNAPLDLWVYENGGGSCIMLAWNINNQGWEIVPDEAFLTSYIQSDITTSTETTWESTTTSTIQQMTTSTIAQSTTVPVTSVPISTIPQTTYTIPPEPTMPEPPATVPLPPIVEPATLDTIPLPPEIESFPPETLELPPEIVDTMPDVVDTYPTVYPPYTLPFVGQLPDPPDTMPLPPDIFPDAPETLDTLPIELIVELPPELVEALQNANEDVSLTDEQFTTAVETIANLAPEEAVALITQILNTAITIDQATELASNPDVLAIVTSEQAEEIFATIDVTELDNTQITELIAAVQSAPVKVRTAFEKTINIFGSGLDNYVPIGSNIPVSTRRTLIAVVAGTAMAAVGSKKR